MDFIVEYRDSDQKLRTKVVSSASEAAIPIKLHKLDRRFNQIVHITQVDSPAVPTIHIENERVV